MESTGGLLQLGGISKFSARNPPSPSRITLHSVVFYQYCDLISHPHAHTHTRTHTHTQRQYIQKGTAHTWADKLRQPYKYILSQPAMCSQQLCVLYEMHNLRIQQFTLQSSTMSCFSEVTQLKAVKRGFFRETQRILIEMV